MLHAEAIAVRSLEPLAVEAVGTEPCPNRPGPALTTPPPQVLVELLSNATRRAILRIVLAEEDAISPMEISMRVNGSLSNVNYHVRVLERDDGLTLDHVADGRSGLRYFYVSGPLVKAFPEFVNAALTAEGGDPA